MGDLINKALSTVGITSELVEEWLGTPCHCKQRQEKLNQLTYWARRVLSGKTERALHFLYGIIDDE